MLALEQKQRQTNAFVDRQITKRKAILNRRIFQTKMGSMPGKLRFWWTYQVGMLSGKILPKWVNGFGLKPYQGLMLENPFQVKKQADTT